MWPLIWRFRYCFLRLPLLSNSGVTEYPVKPMIAVTARIAVDLKLFRHVVNEGPVASARLAELCCAEELLISLLT